MKHHLNTALGIYSEKSLDRFINGDGIYSVREDHATPEQEAAGKTYLVLTDNRGGCVVLDRESSIALYQFLQIHLSREIEDGRA